jgi:hypothetical protein
MGVGHVIARSIIMILMLEDIVVLGPLALIMHPDDICGLIVHRAIQRIHEQIVSIQWIQWCKY